MSRPSCCIQNCTLKARYGFSVAEPTHCYRHKLEKHKKTRSSLCRFRDTVTNGKSFCRKEPIYGPRGEKGQYCLMHRDERIDVNQKSILCQYPNCQTAKVQEKGSKFCTVHELESLPFDYLKLVRQIRGNPKPIILPPSIRKNAKSIILPSFQELTRSLPEFKKPHPEISEYLGILKFLTFVNDNSD